MIDLESGENLVLGQYGKEAHFLSAPLS